MYVLVIVGAVFPHYDYLNFSCLSFLFLAYQIPDNHVVVPNCHVNYIKFANND